MQEARAFGALGSKGLLLAQTVLLCKIWMANDPVANCNVADLMQNAKCFACLTPNQLQVLQTQLLCEILQSGGGGGDSCIFCSTASDPVNVPDCSCALHYRRDIGKFWYWDSDALQWQVLLQ